MKLLAIFVLGLLLVPGTPAQAGNGAPACPSQDLSTFLIAFSESIELQKSFTRFPLKKSYDNVDAKLKLTRVERLLGREQMQFPIIPSAAERKTKGLRLLINADDEKEQQARAILRPDSGGPVYYFFVRTSCWELMRIEDWSF